MESQESTINQAQNQKSKPQEVNPQKQSASQIEEEIHKLSQISLNECIGQGTNVNVYRYKLKNYRMAVKIYKNKDEANTEGIILNKIKKITQDCPGIAPYYGIKKLMISINGQIPYEDFALFFEDCQEDLDNYLKSGKILEIKEVFNIVKQVCLALMYLHANDCYHRDLKLANILINKKGENLNCYLADFIESKSGQYISANYETLSIRGTLFNLPPELWSVWIKAQQQAKYNPIKVDAYCLGIIVLELLLDSNQVRQLNQQRGDKTLFNSELQNIENLLMQKIPQDCQNIFLLINC